ncbi:MAG: arylesterase [Proteobacteria bacterium]|nr:arylesterase [Pseudomonadota bacterium]
MPLSVAQVIAGAQAGGAELFYERLCIALHRAGDRVLPVIRRNAARAGRLRAAGLEPVQLAFANPVDFTTRRGIAAALRGLDPRDMETNIAAILDALAAKHIPVLLTGMYAPPNFGKDYQRAFRAAFDRLGARPDVIYDPFFLEGVAEVPGLVQADGLHPNAEGVKQEVQRILPLVDKLLAKAGG